jgi:tetratricopeptide (TPR) repeat protein
VPGYEILDELGRGGMGVVYLARQVRLNRLCALKMILAGDHASKDAAVRFQTEAETIAKLRHINIAQIYHIGDHEGRVFLEMEYLAGGSLAEQLDGTPWPARKAAELVAALARGVGHAHRLRIIHRDLKPGNVLMETDGTPKIADFGLAKAINVESGLTQTDSILGSPSYMAPEQAAGHARNVGEGADVYALGAILYELLTGRPPFRAATLLETLEQVKMLEPVSPSRLVPGLPHDIETICLKCLQKEPAKRYASVATLEDDLRRYCAGEPILARRISTAERTWRWCRRNPVVSGLVAALLMVLVGGLTTTTAMWLRADAMRLRADAMRLRADAMRLRADRLRAEAEANFDQARSAVDDYLTRVAESRLLGVPGLQPLRKELLESALPYYQSFVRQRAGDPALRDELASAFGRLGRINAELGRHVDALRDYHQALEILSTRSARNGEDDPQLQIELARVHQSVGDVHRDIGDRPAALQSYQAAQAIWRGLEGLPKASNAPPVRAAQQGGIPEHRLDLAILLERIGTVQEQAGELEDAVRTYSEALHLDWDAARDKSKPSETMVIEHHLAKMFTKMGDLQVELKMAPDALRWVFGNAVIDASDFGAGPGDRYPFYRRAQSILERLIRDAPAHERINDFKRDLADCHEHTALALLKAGRADEALPLFGRALMIREPLAAQNPAVIEYQEGLARVATETGHAQGRAARWKEATDMYRQAVDHERVVVATSPTALAPLRALARQLAGLGEAESNLGRPAQALDDLRQACTFWDRLRQPEADDLYELAKSRAACARLAARAKPKLSHSERDQVERDSSAAVAAFSRAIDAGFENLGSARTDPALDALRARDDFKVQMARLQAIAQGPEWLTDWEEAKRRAAAQGKNLFIYFSGSDWCPWCRLLKTTVFDKREFARYAERHFVLLQLDDPHRTAAPTNSATRARLERRWKLDGVPNVVLADARGRAYALVPNPDSEESRRAYNESAERLRKARTDRDDHLAHAAAAMGVERARDLDRGLSTLSSLPRDVLMVEYGDVIAEMVALDPQNHAGLKGKYAGYRELVWKARHEEAQEALNERDWQGALAQFDAILAELTPTGPAAQDTWIGRALALRGIGKNSEAEAEVARAVAQGRTEIDERMAAFQANPSSAEGRKALSDGYGRQIVRLQKLGLYDEARAMALERQALWPDNAYELYNVGCELALSAPRPQRDAAAGLDSAAAEMTRRRAGDQAIGALGRSVLAGFADVSWMARDPDLEILHDRDDFRALLRSLRELGGPSTPTSEVRRFEGHEPPGVRTVRALPDGRGVVSAGLDQTLRLWDMQTGRQVHREKTSGRVLAMALSADGHVVLTGGLDKAVQVWDLGGRTRPRRIELDSSVTSLASAPGGQRALAGLGDGSIRLLDLETGRELFHLRTQSAGAVRAVAFLPDGRRALTGGDDKTVRLWDLETRRELSPLREARGTISSLALSRDGRRALAGGDDGIVWIWNTDDWRPIRRLEKTSDAVGSAAFLPDGRRVISAHGSGRLIIWDIETGRELLRLFGPGGGLSMDVLPGGDRVLTAGSDGLIRLWSLEEDLVRPFELDLLGRWAEADAMLAKSLRSRPDDPRLWILRGRHDLLLGHWDEAAADYRKALDGGKDDPRVLGMVAEALRVELPTGEKRLQRLLDLLDPKWPRSMALWIKMTRPVMSIGFEAAADGCQLTSLDPATGAGRSGLQQGDLMTEVAGRRVVDERSYRAALRRFAPGQSVTVNFRRGSSSSSRSVTLGSLPIPFVVRHDLTREALDADNRRFLDTGYRPARIAAYAGRQHDPRYGGLWIKDGVSFLMQLEATADAFHKQSRKFPKSYRPAWLSISGSEHARRWSAVWLDDPDGLPWRQDEDLSRSLLLAMIQERAAEGYRPTIIAAYRGPGTETRYSGVWVKDGTQFLTRVHITNDELQRQLSNLPADWRPDWIEVYKEQGRRFVTANFIKDDARLDWRLTTDTPVWGVSTMLKKMRAEGFAPVLEDLE